MMLLTAFLFLIALVNSVWDTHNFPKQAKPELCGMTQVSALCDPDHLLTKRTKLAVSNRLEELRTKLPVKECVGREAQWEIAFALVRKLDPVFISGTNGGKEVAVKRMAKFVHDNWQVGDAECQTGVVLFLSLEDRYMHFSTGKGAKSVFTNTLLNEVIDRMKDKLRARDTAGALLGALDDMERIAEKGYVTNPFWTYAFWSAVFVFVLAALYYSNKSQRRYNEVRRKLNEMERREAENLEQRFDIDSCMVCFEDFPTSAEEKKEKSRLLRCGHRFCNGCIQSWIDAGHDTCPLCRKRMGATDDDDETDDDSPPPNQPINRNNGRHNSNFSDSWGNCTASSPTYGTYRRTLRNHRFNRLQYLYPGIITDVMMRTWTRPGYRGGYATSSMFRQANPSAQNSSRRTNSSGGRSFGGGSSRGGSGTGGGW